MITENQWKINWKSIKNKRGWCKKDKKIDGNTCFNKRFYILQNQIQVFKKVEVTQLGKPINYWEMMHLISRPETSSKRDSSTGIFQWILWNVSKNLIYRTPLNDCFCWFLDSNQSFIHWSQFFSFFLHFFFLYYWQLQLCSLFRKVIKMKIFHFLQ